VNVVVYITPAPGTLALSPSDDAAIDAALRLRAMETIGSVTVVSAASAPSADVLRGALARGVDDTLSLTVPARADGSLATSTLAFAEDVSADLRERDFDIAIFSDEPFGGVHQGLGAMVAELVELPAATAVTGFVASAGSVEGTTAMATAGEVVRLLMPCILTLADGAARTPRIPSWEVVAEATGRPIEERSVVSGEIQTRVSAQEGGFRRKSLQHPVEVVHAPGAKSISLPVLNTEITANPVLAFIELRADGVQPNAREVISAACAFADAVGSAVFGVMIGPPGHAGSSAELGALGVERIFVAEDPLFNSYNAGAWTSIVAGGVGALSPHAVVFPDSGMGRDLAPRVAARVGAAYAADCVDLELSEADSLIVKRFPRSGDAIVREEYVAGPVMISICSGAFPPREQKAAGALEFLSVNASDMIDYAAVVVSSND
jgi:electron transfer flavoprotein alpha/beta subunit